jgi:outer membrane protein assembly factor BamB
MILCMVVCCLMAGELVAKDYYVSPEGSDGNVGSKQKPFATLARARDAIREAGIAGRERVNVVLTDGIHLLGESFVLEPQDSGSETAPVVYRAENEGKAIISGATRLMGLKWERHKGGIMKATVPDDVLRSCKFDAVTVGDIKLHMARFPNYTGQGNFDGVTNIEAVNKRAQGYKRPTTGYLHALHRSRWGSVHYRITGKDGKGLKLEGGWQQNRHRQLNAGNVMVENVFEELDEAGEWFLDREAGILYVYPVSGMDLSREPLYVTNVKDLIVFAGSADEPIRYVSVEGIEFRHAHRVVMESEENWEPLNRGDWSIVRSGAVMLTGTEHCTIKDCFFNATGGNGVFFNDYNRHSAVRDCRFEKLGDSAVAFVGNHACTRSNPIGYENSIAYSKQDLTPGPKGNDFPKDCMMDGCLVFAIGRVGKQTAGCFISMAQNITVSHNTIYHVPRSGITVNDGCWGGHIIEHNDVFDTVIETGDHGPFNSWGRDRYWLTRHHSGKGYREDTVFDEESVPQIEAQRRSRLDCVTPIVIRNNRWMHNTESHSWGIDLDDGSSNYHVYNNLCLGCSVKLREGFYRRVENNIFIGGRAIQQHVPFDHNMDYICRNIVVPAKPETMPWRNDKRKILDAEKIDNNLYWSAEQYRNPGIEHKQLKEFQAAGIDVHSVSADPKFIDPENYDLRVADDSPALKLGFENFSMGHFGVRKPEFKEIADRAHKEYQKFNPEQIWGPFESADTTARASEARVHTLLGAKVKDLTTEEEKSVAGVGELAGVYVIEVPKGSAAAEAGIVAGDAILAVNGRKVVNVAALRKRLKRAKGKSVELHVVGAKDRKIKLIGGLKPTLRIRTTRLPASRRGDPMWSPSAPASIVQPRAATQGRPYKSRMTKNRVGDKLSTLHPLAASGVKGGLVVCVGCDDPELLAELGEAGPYLVHGLDADATQVEAAKQLIQSKGAYGKVAVDVFDGESLPYVDSLVNLLVVLDSECTISDDEMDRILAPRGVGIVSRDGTDRVKFTKPVPADIDDWTHFLHGPDNNAVAEDTVVGPPRHIQWCSEPMWGRDHHWEKGTYPTVRTVLSSRGRLISLIDQTETSDMTVPSKWAVVARDAFSGVLLWTRPIRLKSRAEQKPKWGLEQVWRQLIADEGHAYIALAPDKPLSALDLDTGNVVRSFDGTSGYSEVIKDRNTLFLVMPGHEIVAADARTGRRLWRWTPGDDGEIIRLTLAAAGGRVFVKTDRSVVCLSADSGEPLWRRELAQSQKKTKLYFPREKLIVKDGVVLVSYGGKDPVSLNKDIQEFLGSHPRVREYDGKLAALSAEDGSILWESAYLPNLEGAPGETYVSDGLVWLGPDFTEARELRTGKVKHTRNIIERLWTDGHHYRCYPGKATSRYIITAKRGIEMIDMYGENHSRNNWVRGTCRVGVTTCNGLIYAPPHSCGCYVEAKIYGFHALAPMRTIRSSRLERLEKGPAYAKIINNKSQIANSTDWPTFRHDAARSGSTETSISSVLNRKWKADVGGRLSGVTVAGGKVFVACVDAHTVHALDAASGKKLWQFTAGARVNSPPTLHDGLALFGSADGYVYCLRASDGELVWRFLASPQRLDTVAFDQLESVWPVHGSVLVKDDVAYAAAGRCSYLDGGIMLYGLEPATGKVVARRLIESEHVGTMDPPPEGTEHSSTTMIRQNTLDYKTFLAADRSDAFSMSGVTNDVLVADGDSIYLRHMRFNDKLEVETSGRPHLYSTSSLLDDWEHNRSYWILGTGDLARTPVAYPWIIHSDLAVPFGLMMAFDDNTVWAVRRAGGRRANKSEPGIYAVPRPNPLDESSFLPDFQKRTTAQSNAAGVSWKTDLSKNARAILHAGDTVVVGGRDAEGGFLQTFSAQDGAARHETRLEASPVWDGLAVAAGRLYVPLDNGTLVCLGEN